MDRLTLQIEKNEWQVDIVRILINGIDLIETAREIEAPFAEAEEHPRISGAYQPLPAEGILPPSQHFLGRPEGVYVYDGRVQLLACHSCGEPGCWPLTVMISVHKDTVIWSDFKQPRRGPNSILHWRYDNLGPFVFDRQPYEDELEKARAATSDA